MVKQEQFLNVIDRDEAERRFLEAIRVAPVGQESIALADALGRVLADDVIAESDVPGFDRSNYDGFAVRAADTFGATEEKPRTLTLLGETILTAILPNSEIHPGTAAAIVTGAVLPRGADGVVMIEDTDTKDDDLVVRRAITPGFGVTFAGTDISAGETVLRRGGLLTSRETGVLAAIGRATVEVFRRPRVGIISTGDEIVEPGSEIRPGQVFDSNARILADAVEELGGSPCILGIVRDDAEKLHAIVTGALETYDCLLLSGGTSKGVGDISYRIIRELTRPGVVAHGVALKPGKPICLASHLGKPVVVLPGFPTSAIFTFHEFVAPVLRLLAGRDVKSTPKVLARMSVRINSEIGRTEYLLVGLVERSEVLDNEPALAAHPMGKGSGSVTSFSRADGFVTISRHQEIVEDGQEVEVQLLSPDLQLPELVIIGSHCVGLDFLLGQLQSLHLRSKFLAVGSTGGLEAVRRGECDIAGIHLLDPETGSYNEPFLSPELQLIPGYRRMQGIIYRAGDERFSGLTVEQIVQHVTRDSSCVMINRNRGSGTRILVDQLLKGIQPHGYPHQARNHNAVAVAILQGRADWGMAIESVSRPSGLEFLPVTEEHFDFVVSRRRSERVAVREFRNLLSEPTVCEALSRLGCHVKTR
jgi:putative molybdopterin biosynthesis protein